LTQLSDLAKKQRDRQKPDENAEDKSVEHDFA
jgi:hypothetical protein